jgi:aryl-alcohol dehydrogenase-like predicted oxidoreductase
MQKRKLGRSSLEVSPVAFGGNIFGWTVDEPPSFKLLDAVAAAGINFIDTADIYSKWAPGNKGGESETILGKWLKRSGLRRQMIVATKVGMEMAPDKKGLARVYVMRAVEDSLRRLQTDYIDLYQSHIDDPSVPLEETLAAFSQLIAQGKVRAIGASNYGTDRLARALEASREHDYARYECLQPSYNLYDRADYEAKLEPLCAKEGLGVIPYFSLASGFLTGKLPLGSRPGQKRSRPRGQEVPHRPRPPHLAGAGPSGRRPRGRSRPGGAGLAYGPFEHHGSHRQRHQPRAAHRPRRGHQAQAGSLGHCPSRPGQRLRLIT